MALKNLKGLSDLAKAAKGNKGKEVLLVPVDDVVSKAQIRKRFRNIEELAATLLTEGQQSPVIVFPKNEEGKYVIQKGERRWRACKVAGIATIEILVNDKVQSTLDETAGELIENIQRDGLTPIEISEALNDFIKEGWKQAQIAERIGKNISFVSTHLSLLNLPDCVRELYDNEQCSDTETLNNLRLLYDLNQERCRAVCAVALSDGITRKQSRELLNDAKRIKEEMEKNHQADQLKSEQGAPLELNSKEDTATQPSDQVITEPAAEIQTTGVNESSEQSSDAVGSSQDGTTTQVDVKSSEQTDSLNNEGGDALPPLPKDKPWKNVRADSLIFVVTVKIDGENKRGVICTDRVSLEPSKVWVKTLDSKNAEQHIHVPASDINLLGVEG